MDRRIKRLSVGLLVLWILLFGAVNYVQVLAADRISENPANAFRQLVAEYGVDRGRILASDGTVLALSRKSRGVFQYQRRYPGGDRLAAITGFYSLVFGRSELEQSFNDYLIGDAPELLPTTLGDLILGRPKRGATIITSIDVQLQDLAMDLVNDPAAFPEGGAIFAMEPSTGNVLAVASNPSFDPNALASQDRDEVRRAWRQLNADPDKPMLSRANDELYPPGSTFKMVTAAAALENGYTPNTLVPNPPVLDLPQTDNVLQNFGGGVCSGGSQIPLREGFRQSCNVTFGGVALDLGAERLAEQARRFGLCLTAPPDSTCLSEEVPFDTPWAQGRFPEASFFADQLPLLAFAGIGQSDVATNPMSMGLVAAAIANGGVQMRPRLVTEIRDPQGRVIQRFEPTPFAEAVSPETAQELTEMMVSVVSSGTGSAAQVPGVQVAGKTGTAQHGEGRDPHAWFVGFAPAEAPEVVVAVIVLDGGSLSGDATGGALAAPVAQQVMEAALG